MRLKGKGLLLAAAALLLAGVQPAAAQTAHTSYSGMNWGPDPIAAAQPKWRAATDAPKEDYDLANGFASAAAGGGQVYVLQKGKLTAIQAKSGKKLWSFGQGLTYPLLYADGTVYANAADGTLYAVDAAKGKKKWGTTVKTPGVMELYANGGRVYEVNGDVKAFDEKTGKALWTDGAAEPVGGRGQAWFVGGKIVFPTTISGAYSYEALLALDEATGKPAWTAANASPPLALAKDRLTVQRTSNMLEQTDRTLLDTLDAATGKPVSTAGYKEMGRAWIDGDRVYIDSAGAVYAYPLGADPAKAAPTVYKPDGSRPYAWAGGPDAGRLLFTDGSQLDGVKLVNRMPVGYGWLGNPIARFDTFGNGLYAALTDGKVVAVDLTTAKRVFQLQMPSRIFGPTLQIDGMIVVQSKGSIAAAAEPASLKAAG